MADNTTYTVKVQRAMQDCEVDDYVIDGGWVPFVESSSDRELWIYRNNDDETLQTLVAVYGTGMWLRTWIEEDA